MNLSILFCIPLLLQVCNGFLMDDESSGVELQLMNLRSELAAVKSKLDFVTENINSECNLRCPESESVAFMAQLSATINNPSKGLVILFDDVVSNVGNAYNPGHGIFTAPVNGTYNFNLIASVPPTSDDHFVHLFIKKNAVQVGYVFLDSNHGYWLRRTTDVTLHLARNDEIWVEVDDVHGSRSIGGCCFHTHFSGFMIKAD